MTPCHENSLYKKGSGFFLSVIAPISKNISSIGITRNFYIILFTMFIVLFECMVCLIITQA